MEGGEIHGYVAVHHEPCSHLVFYQTESNDMRCAGFKNTIIDPSNNIEMTLRKIC